MESGDSCDSSPCSQHFPKIFPSESRALVGWLGWPHGFFLAAWRLAIRLGSAQPLQSARGAPFLRQEGWTGTRQTIWRTSEKEDLQHGLRELFLIYHLQDSYKHLITIYKHQESGATHLNKGLFQKNAYLSFLIVCVWPSFGLPQENEGPLRKTRNQANPKNRMGQTVHSFFEGPQPMNLTGRDSMMAQMHSCEQSDDPAEPSRCSLHICSLWN